NLDKVFPDDPIAGEIQAESAVGVVIKKGDGMASGVLAAYGKRRISEEFLVSSIMEIVAGRISAELGRHRVMMRNTALVKANEQLLRHLIKVQEEERRFLARELHDEFGQWLSAIQAEAHLITELSVDHEGQTGIIHDSAGSINCAALAMHDVIRNMIHRLRPSILDELGVSSGVEYLLSQWGMHNQNVNCRYSISPALDRLPEAVSITAYRIIQEAMTNISRHASAANADVSADVIRSDKGRRILVIEVVDDGVGIENHILENNNGLSGIRERVAASGGGVDVVSPGKSGCGTEIHVTIPVTIEERKANVGDKQYTGFIG
nr:hypothetical protein [Gammaproteobacteria bacterium]NIR93590.1 hypothetical protein [Gammaproteobacteria bacterium]NIW45012.1 hypothetical protein [Gammaproteobacteria bacterium]NIX56241.1 hypothetical protein [candidate division Zixibacteria bacterium]